MENQTTKTPVPSSLRELPIFNPGLGIGNFIENQIPEQLKTPEAKKTLGRIFFWGGMAGLVMFLYKMMPTVLDALKLGTEFIWQAIFFLVSGIIFLLLISVSPGIVRFFSKYLNRMFALKFHNMEKKQIEDDPIGNLELELEEVNKTQREVRSDISDADAARGTIITQAQDMDKEADQKYQQIKGIDNEVKEMVKEAEVLRSKGYAEQARAKERKADENTKTALMIKAEADSYKDTAATFLQYANEYGKAIEILRDNESDLTILSRALKISVNILKQKLDASSLMKSASDKLSSAFQIKDSWIFKVALQAAQANISKNVAAIRSNLQFLNQNRTMNLGSAGANREALAAFVKDMNDGKIKRLNISEISDPGHDLTPDERKDKSFNILD